jgi:hypothetical protein
LSSRDEVPRRVDRAFVVPALPVRPSWFPTGSFGFSLPVVVPEFSRSDTLLTASCSSPRSYCCPSTAPGCASRCTSHGVSSPTAFHRSRRPYSPEVFDPPARSVPGVSHALDGFLHLQPCGVCFAPATLVGLTRTSSARSRPFDRSRAGAPGVPLQGVLLVRDEHVFACSPLSHFAGSSRPGEPLR